MYAVTGMTAAGASHCCQLSGLAKKGLSATGLGRRCGAPWSQVGLIWPVCVGSNNMCHGRSVTWPVRSGSDRTCRGRPIIGACCFHLHKSKSGAQGVRSLLLVALHVIKQTQAAGREFGVSSPCVTEEVTDRPNIWKEHSKSPALSAGMHAFAVAACHGSRWSVIRALPTRLLRRLRGQSVQVLNLVHRAGGAVDLRARDEFALCTWSGPVDCQHPCVRAPRRPRNASRSSQGIETEHCGREESASGSRDRHGSRAHVLEALGLSLEVDDLTCPVCLARVLAQHKREIRDVHLARVANLNSALRS